MLINKRLWVVMTIIVIYTLISGLFLIYVPINIYCFLYPMQNILFPILAVRYLFNNIKPYNHTNLRLIGAFVGGATGLFPTTLMVFVPIVLIYLNRGEQITINNKLFFATIAVSGTLTWLGLVILSALAGFFH